MPRTLVVQSENKGETGVRGHVEGREWSRWKASLGFPNSAP